MEPKFKSSFIPNNPLQQPVARPAVNTVRHHGSSVGLGYILTLALFILSVLASGGVYFYSSYIDGQVATLVQEIESKKNQEPATVAVLKRFDDRIETSKKLLSAHTALTGFFTLLEKGTLGPVQITRVSILGSPNEVEAKTPVTIEGVAIDIDTVALQHKTFLSSDGIVDGLVTKIDNSSEPGKVLFTFEGNIENRFISFRELLFERNPGMSDDVDQETDRSSLEQQYEEEGIETQTTGDAPVVEQPNQESEQEAP